jgi:hypothetical protein
MNLQLWFDTKFESSLDGLAFSRSPLLSVYLCGNPNFKARFRVTVPRRPTEPARPRHRRVHPTHWLISTQACTRT